MTDLDAFANGRDEAVGVKSVRSTMVSLQAGFFSLLHFVGAGYLMVSLNSGSAWKPTTALAQMITPALSAGSGEL